MFSGATPNSIRRHNYSLPNFNAVPAMNGMRAVQPFIAVSHVTLGFEGESKGFHSLSPFVV
jgi:hypothetical protein